MFRRSRASACVVSPGSVSRTLTRRLAATGALVTLALTLESPPALAGEIPDEPGDQGTVVLPAGHAWRFFRGTQEPPADWNQPGFDDSAWEIGPTGIGYGDEDDETVLADMRCTLIDGAGEGENRCSGGGYLAFFARATFEAPAIPEGQKLLFKVSYDDGVVLHVNGVQVGRINMPDGPVSSQTAALKAVGDAPAEPDAVLVIPAELLRDGTNLLAASVHNANLSSSDASFVPRLVLGTGEDPGPDPEPTCRERCAAHAAEVAAKCSAEGLPEEECAARKAAALEQCILTECEDKPPEEPTCKARCEEGAAKVLRQCLEEGGTEDQCRERSSAALRECVAGCEEKPPEKPCADECAASGDAVFIACLEAGGDKEECRQRANAIVALCLERCGAGTPCEDRCAVAAQIVLTGCNLAGLPEADCRAIAGTVLERCVGGCEPPPTCESGCAELAQRAVAECQGREGSEEECAAAGAAVLAECTAHCEGEPVPDCDVQCEAKAAEMFESCVAKGLPEGECQAERETFLARCNEELGKQCQQELAALQSSFRLFRRGDATRDDRVDITDAVFVLGALFLGTELPRCEDAADANDDGTLNIADPIMVLGSLFLGSGPLPPPATVEGQDPTSDRLLCED